MNTTTCFRKTAPSSTNLPSSVRFPIALGARICAVVMLTLQGWPMLAGEVPSYGSPAFLPSADQPVAFKGNGNGYFPGATLVSEFWEGTPKHVQQDAPDRGPGQKIWVWELDIAQDGANRKNIIWKTKMPSWANTQPIVVGDRVFTTADPDYLVGCDAGTGAILWAARQNAWEIAGLAPDKAKVIHRLFDIGREAIPNFGAMHRNGTNSRLLMPEEFKPLMDVYIKSVLPRAIVAIKEVDPWDGWDGIAARQVAGLEEYLKLLTERRKPLDHDRPKDTDIMSIVIGQRIKDLTGPGMKSIRTGIPWGHGIGFAVSPPVSDGKFVYASFGQGQTVCYTLDGRRVWSAYNPQQGADTCHMQSMLLAGDVLVDVHGGGNLIRGLNTATGKTLWEAAGASEGGGGGGYYVGSNIIMPLKDGGKVEPVVVTVLGNFIRVRDGKILGSYVYNNKPGGWSGGSSMVYSGDVLYKFACWDGGAAPINAFRVSLSGDSVKAEKIWQSDKPPGGYHARVAMPDHYLVGGSVYSSTTGAKADSPCGGLSSLVIGKTWIWAEDGCYNPLQSHWSCRRWDGKALAVFHSADVRDPMAPNPQGTAMVLGDSDFPNMPTMQELAPELYANPGYTHLSYGKPGHGLHTDNALFPHGDRLYIRTVSSLYCIGPSVKGTAKDNPAVAKKIRTLTDVADLLPYLDNASAQYRFEAAQVLLQLAPKAAEAKWRELAKNDAYEEIRALAIRGMDAASSDGKAGANLLKELILLTPKYGGLDVRLRLTLKALGTDYTTIIPILLSLVVDDKNLEGRYASAMALAEIGYKSPEIRDMLVQRLQVDGKAFSGEDDPRIRTLLLRSLATWPIEAPIKEAMRKNAMLGGNHWWVRADKAKMAFDYLRKNLPAAELLPVLKELSTAEDKDVAEAAKQAVARIEGNRGP